MSVMMFVVHVFRNVYILCNVYYMHTVNVLLISLIYVVMLIFSAGITSIGLPVSVNSPHLFCIKVKHRQRHPSSMKCTSQKLLISTVVHFQTTGPESAERPPEQRRLRPSLALNG